MFMGGKAFAYYFPVIESYLLETPNPNETDEIDFRPTCILGYCIQTQFSDDSLQHVSHLAPRVKALIDHVRQTIDVYAADPEEQRRITESWNELEEHMLQIGAG